jgi:putative transposase
VLPKPHPRALSDVETKQILTTLHSYRFTDQSPAEVYATLLDEGTYLCSLRSMYRILQKQGETRERRAIVHHGKFKKPELLATEPNQVWSWDITKLLGPQKWTYFYLYVLMDIFSRYVVGWMVAERESGSLATVLMREACEKQNIVEGALTIHSDRGGPMISKPVAHLMADLGVIKSLSRPQVSNDNPFSEAQFKTLKYCPTFPERFGSKQDADVFCRYFFTWYNQEHKHSGIGYYTPEDVHYGRALAMQKLRQNTLSSAFAAHPERFVKKSPIAASAPTAVWINPPVINKKTVGLAPEAQPMGSELDARTQQFDNHGRASVLNAQSKEGKDV